MTLPILLNLAVAAAVCVLLYRMQASHQSFTRRVFTGLGLGVIEGFTKVFYPEASSTVVFVIMVIVLLIRPAGLFGKEK